MYTPKQFQISDRQEAIDFIKRYSFGILVTTENNLPIATHIPFTIKQHDDELVLTAHIALANPQVSTLLNGRVLAIFSEPHAYVSPQYYEKRLSVPTWNYLAVHAYGKLNIITDAVSQFTALEEMISRYEPGYLKQWDGLPQDYKDKMIKGIVAFDILVDDLQGTKKLSQNKTAIEQANIINAFNAGNATNEKEIAAYMVKQAPGN